MKKKNIAWLSFVFNPLVVVVYSVTCFVLYNLAQYGGIERRVPIILAGTLILLVWFAWCLYRYFKYRKSAKKLPIISSRHAAASKWWIVFAGVTMFSITLVTGTAIYQNAVNQEGNLYAFIQRQRNTRQVAFVHDNLYNDRLEGLLEDIQQEIPLPPELYISNEFELTFDRDGEITAIYSFLYGLNEENETESFLIDYDSSVSEYLTVYLNGHVNADYDEAKKLQPLLDIVKTIPLEEVVAKGNNNTWGLYYSGLRNWGYNTNGLVWVDAGGNVNEFESAPAEMIGYTVSIYAPEDEAITPLRFIEIIPAFHPLYEELRIKEPARTAADTFFLNEGLGYQLTVADAAMGERFYILDQTVDGGETWETINPDPFSGNAGIASGIVFLDEQFGFIGLSKSGGSNGNLYRTRDGGLTFHEVLLPANDSTSPFDHPEMPYRENGKLMLLVNQGQDGDYNGGSKALYQSNDDGETWIFVKEVK